MRSLCIPVLFALSLMLSACGGGGSDASGIAVVSDPTGVWQGTVTENGVGSYTVVGLIYDNQLRFVSVDAGTLYEGTIDVSGTTFTATTTNISLSSGAFATSNLTGTVTTGGSISGTYTSSNGATGSFSLTYDPVTDRGASLATADGNWSVTDGTFTMALAIDSNGVLSGSDTDGCVYNGSLAVPDPDVNIYTVALSAASCGVFNGSYTGYAVVGDTMVQNDTLTFVVSNADYIVLGELARQ